MTGNLEQIRLLESIEELTSKDGRFEFLGLALDVRYAVIAKRKGFAFAKSDVFELVENDPDHEVELSLSKGWSISGRVYTSEGEPAPGVLVRDRPDFAKKMRCVVQPDDAQ